MKKTILLFISISLIFSACEQTPTPKPTAYYRITLPQPEYQIFKTDTCPFSFEYSVFANISPLKDADNPPCWYDINYKKFNAKIHLTFRKIDNNLDSLLDDSHTLVYKHVIKADAINVQDFINDSLKIYATVFYIQGNAASPLQFQIMDSTKYFLRGSVYFNVTPNADSLAPAIKFVEDDVKYFIESFEWQNILCDACY
ncbi:MAG: gliding motility lipoprotein GldD [Bacteroidales bacterium]|nr:gliding motility lipoprotein GldD [Bacteroidales bacterium]